MTRKLLFQLPPQISSEQKLNLFNTLHDLDFNGQGTYHLLGLVNLIPVGRCRNGTYEEPTDSRRQHTVAICVPDGAGGSKRVFKKTFKDIFDIKSSKKLNY